MLSVKAATVRTALIVAGALLAITGLITSIMDNYHLAMVCWCTAYLCKWVECWLLERATLTS